MYSKIIVNFPKEEGKKYFSREHQNYENNLSISINDDVIFSGVNDAEEYLPITLEKNYNFNNSTNTIIFFYDITFHPDIKEYGKIILNISEKRCSICIVRDNFVQGSENLDNYIVTIDINGQKHFLDKEWHCGDSNQILFNGPAGVPCVISWSSKKSFVNGKHIYYDDTEVVLL